MGAVGLFDAKTHFSEYVARAEAGEEVIITRHNKPVAKIVPLHASTQTQTRFDPVKRQHAIDLMKALKAKFKAEGVSISGHEFARWRREAQDERAHQALGMEKPAAGLGRRAARPQKESRK